MNYFPQTNPWQALAVIGDQIGRNLSQAFVQEPQQRFQNAVTLHNLGDQATMQQWQMGQGDERLRLAQEEESRRRLLDQATLSLHQQQMESAKQNAALAQQVQRVMSPAPSSDVMSYMPEVLGGGLEAGQAQQQRQLQSLGAQQAALHGTLGSFVQGMERQDTADKKWVETLVQKQRELDAKTSQYAIANQMREQEIMNRAAYMEELARTRGLNADSINFSQQSHNIRFQIMSLEEDIKKAEANGTDTTKLQAERQNLLSQLQTIGVQLNRSITSGGQTNSVPSQTTIKIGKYQVTY